MEYFLVVETQLNRTPSHILRNTRYLNRNELLIYLIDAAHLAVCNVSRHVCFSRSGSVRRSSMTNSIILHNTIIYYNIVWKHSAMMVVIRTLLYYVV